MPSTSRLPRASRSFLVGAALALAACGGANGNGTATVPEIDDARSSELAEVLRSNGLTSASSAVEAIGLDALSDAGEYTFFVPSDEAFQSLGADEIADLFDDGDRLVAVLRDHLVPGKISSADLEASGELSTESGKVLLFDGTVDPPTIDGAPIVDVDIAVGTSGVIHVIDRIVGS